MKINNLALKDRVFLEMTQVASGMSKCPKAQYAAIVVDRDGRVASTGYNGKPRGSVNDDICLRPSLLPGVTKQECCLHAEHNAITMCDQKRLPGATMYATGAPCERCALEIMQSGISRVFYMNEPHPVTGHYSGASDEFWNCFGIPVERIKVNL